MHPDSRLPGYILVTLGTECVGHQVFCRNAIGTLDLRQGRQPGTRVAGRCRLPRHDVHGHHDARKARTHQGPAPHDVPAQPGTGQPVKHEQPGDDEGRHHVGPVHQGPHAVIVDGEKLETRQQQSGHQQGNPAGEQSQARADGIPVRSVPGTAHVADGKDKEYRQQDQPQRQMDDEHQQVVVILQDLAGDRLGNGHAPEINRVHRQQGEQQEDDAQPATQILRQHRPAHDGFSGAFSHGPDSGMASSSARCSASRSTGNVSAANTGKRASSTASL